MLRAGVGGEQNAKTHTSSLPERLLKSTFTSPIEI